VPYGCWTFSFTAPANHFGELSGPSPASSASDGTLTCGAGQFLVPGTAGGAVDLDYSFAEYQPTLTITVSKASSDPDPTLTVTAAKQGDSSTTYQPAAVAIGTATSLGFWVAPDVNVDLSVSTGATSTWPTGGSATVSSAAPDATINLVEYTPVVVTVQDALGPVSGAAVTFTSATGALNIGPNSTDAQGHLSISIPYERDWVAHATTSGGESGQSTQFSTSAGETDVSISVH
jgi:hypothetical protein